MPETTIHMTCSTTHKAIKLRLTKGGDVKTAIVGEDDAAKSSART